MNSFKFIISFLLFFSHISNANSKPLIGLLYNSKNDSLSTSNGIENHIKKGLELAIDEINSQKVNFSYKWIDVGETADSTMKIRNQLESNAFDYFIGPSHSFQVELLAKLIEEKKLNTKIVTPAATSDDLLKYKNVIMISNANSVQAKLIIREANIQKNQSILIVNIKDCIYCSNLTKFLISELNALQFPFKLIEFFESEIKDKEKYKSTQSFQHIFIPALENQISDVIESLWDKNQTSSYWSCDGVGTLGRFITQLPFSNRLKISWLSHYHKDIENKRNKEFIKKYYSRYNIDPIDTSAFYYESLLYTVFHLIKNRTFDDFLTGTVTLSYNKIIRKMPVLYLNNGKVNFKHLVAL